jgi:predicted GIY-YIG superfamily endonuclease
VGASREGAAGIHGGVRCRAAGWYEAHETRENAFLRERRLKKWNRLWKLELIEKTNPGWRELYDELSPLG